MLSQYVIDIASSFRCYIWKLCANGNRFIIDGWKQKNRKKKRRSNANSNSFLVEKARAKIEMLSR